MKLYSYWRSTAAYRVRIALHLKDVEFTQQSINLVDGEQNSDSYLSVNSGGLVPALQTADGQVLTQSLAIIEWLESEHPEPALLPQDPIERAKVQAVVQTISCDIHPVNNLRVVQYLSREFGADGDSRKAWMQHWMASGFGGIESSLDDDTTFAFGDQPGLADICIVAQMYNAKRWELDMSPYPRIARIDQACAELPAFVAAAPENQPDAVKA